MANTLYPLYKSVLLTGGTNTAINGVGAAAGTFTALLSAAYTYNNAHQFFTSLTGTVGTPGENTSPTVTNATNLTTYDAADVLYSAVTGAQITQFALYVTNGGANSTWRLFLFEDTGFTAVTPNGGNITMQWNPSGIVQL
jgi:hypothetical protein